MRSAVENLDTRFSIFAYVLTNRTQVLGLVSSADRASKFIIDKVAVTYGTDNLVKTKPATFRDLLLNKNSQDEDD